MTSTVLVFVLGAIAISLATYGGITWMYFAEKRGIDPPRERPLEALDPTRDRVDDLERRAAA
jgi:hypothetical protein